jgi:hypothetical protein
MAYKVFTNGSVLNASEINDNLMRQSVMVFSNSAARTSAISSPVEGMLTYLEDVDRYEHYTGSAWVSPFGMTRLTTSTFSAQTSVSVNSVFSATYRNYKIILNCSSKSVNGAINMRLRASGTDTTTNYNFGGNVFRTNAGTSPFGGNATSLIRVGFSNLADTNYSLDVYNPFLAQNTSTSITGWGGDVSTWYSVFAGGNQESTTSFDGFTILPDSGTITGSLTVYGYRG